LTLAGARFAAAGIILDPSPRPPKTRYKGEL
jgi:hypothetical protein